MLCYNDAFQVNPEKINLIIGSGGKKVKSIIEETGVEAIDTEDDGTVRSSSLFEFFICSFHLCTY